MHKVEINAERQLKLTSDPPHKHVYSYIGMFIHVQKCECKCVHTTYMNMYKRIIKEETNEWESLSFLFSLKITEILEDKIVSLFKSTSIGYIDPYCKPRALLPWKLVKVNAWHKKMAGLEQWLSSKEPCYSSREAKFIPASISSTSNPPVHPAPENPTPSPASIACRDVHNK